MVQQADAVDLFAAESDDPARRELLIRVAHTYSDAVGIIDALRIRGWSDDGLTIPQMRLLWALRDLLGLTGTKFGCGIAQCGACTVHIDGRPVRSCVLPIGAISSRKITTSAGKATRSTRGASEPDCSASRPCRPSTAPASRCSSRAAKAGCRRIG